MKENIVLKFPSGEFTHTELATANGKTNQQVWTAYQKAIKDGIIVSAGERKGAGGKPSKLWKVQDGVIVPVVTVTPAKTEIVSSLLPVSDSTLKLIEKVDAVPLVVEAKLATVKPATPPVEVVEVIEPAPVKVVTNLTGKVTVIDDVCPFCKTKLHSVDVESGVKVWCPINDLAICSCSENPYGCASNIEKAVGILHDKFFKHRPVKA